MSLLDGDFVFSWGTTRMATCVNTGMDPFALSLIQTKPFRTVL